MNALAQLISGHEEEAMNALEVAKESGNIQWVRPMLEAFRDRSEESLRQEIGTMLGALKVSEGAEVMGDALEDPEFAEIHADIIGFLWSCGHLFQHSNKRHNGKLARRYVSLRQLRDDIVRIQGNPHFLFKFAKGSSDSVFIMRFNLTSWNRNLTTVDTRILGPLHEHH